MVTRTVKQKKKSVEEHFSARVKMAMGLVVLIGALATGIWAVDSRYFTRSEAQAQYEGFKELNRQNQKRFEEIFKQSERRTLQGELRALERELFELTNARTRRKLTDLEEARGDHLLREIRRIKEELAQLGGKQ